MCLRVGLRQKSHLSSDLKIPPRGARTTTTPAVHRATMIALLTTATTALSVSGTLGGVKVSPLANGFVSGASVPLSTLWEKRGAVIFAVRRPG